MNEHELSLAGLRTIAVGDLVGGGPVLVLLHGFAMGPEDLAPFAHSLAIPGLFLFPEGPLTGALEPGVPTGRAWWAIDPVARAQALAKGPRDFAEQHPPDLEAVRKTVGHLLDEVISLVPRRPLLLGEFSQGGMLACDTVLRRPGLVDALVLLSASRITFDEWAPRLATAGAPSPVAGLPVFLSHGRTDLDLAFSAGERLRDCLIEAGAAVRWLPFDQGHEVPLVVWRGLRKFVLEMSAVAAPSRPT